MIIDLEPGHIVTTVTVDDTSGTNPARRATLASTWSDGVEGRPLARLTISCSSDGVCVDMEAHHLILDGGAVNLLEEDLGRILRDGPDDPPPLATSVDKLRHAHAAERDHAAQAAHRHRDHVRTELHNSHGPCTTTEPDTVEEQAFRAWCTTTTVVDGDHLRALRDTADNHQVSVPVLLTAGLVAHTAARLQSTDVRVLHAVDPRFIDHRLRVASCLVNTMFQRVSFSAAASWSTLIRTVDKTMVAAQRRGMFREELLRREALRAGALPAGNLTINVLRRPVADQLRPFIDGVPETTHIGPVEGPTIQCVLDDYADRMILHVWDKTPTEPGERQHPTSIDMDEIVKILVQSTPEEPVAPAVQAWVPILGGTTKDRGVERWTCLPSAHNTQGRGWSPGVTRWVTTLKEAGVSPGDIVVLVEDLSDSATDLALATHLVGAGYSPCHSVDDVDDRVSALRSGMPGAGVFTALVQTTGRYLVRREGHATDDGDAGQLRASAQSTAYVMPTSGTTGTPKLVCVTHYNLVAFLASAQERYGWLPTDTVLQCTPLTSDISVEEVFLSALTGARLVRGRWRHTHEPDDLIGDILATGATILDLPTSVWNVMARDPEMRRRLASSTLRAIVIGGEPVDPAAVAEWSTGNTAHIDLLSTYGPTEATVVVSTAQLNPPEPAKPDLRVGTPLIANSMAIAFGQLVLMGPSVAAGYLGRHSPEFGTLRQDGVITCSFSTGDRVSVSEIDGAPIFAGRCDDVVKIAGRRVDVAALSRAVRATGLISDLHMEPVDGRLTVWCCPHVGSARATRGRIGAVIRRHAADHGATACQVVVLDRLPRDARGGVDKDVLRTPVSEPVEMGPYVDRGEVDDLVRVWNACLGVEMGPDTSLTDNAVASLDLIRLLGPTRRLLGREVTVRDLIVADSARGLLAHCAREQGRGGMGADAVVSPRAEMSGSRGGDRSRDHSARGAALRALADIGAQTSTSVLLLGGTGTVGSGILRRWCSHPDLRVAGAKLVLLCRGHGPDIQDESVHVVGGAGDLAEDRSWLVAALDALHPAVVVNAVGAMDVTATEDALRPLNVDVPAQVAVWARVNGARYVHMSSTMASSAPDAPLVTVPEKAKLAYAGSKSRAEIEVCRRGGGAATVVRLPRVLPGGGSGAVWKCHGAGPGVDILLVLRQLCRVVGAYPDVPVREDVLSADGAAGAVLSHIAGLSAVPPGGGSVIVVLRGVVAFYPDVLGEVAGRCLPLREWKALVDASEWPQRNLAAWAVVDEWVRLAESYFSDPPTRDDLVELPGARVVVVSPGCVGGDVRSDRNLSTGNTTEG